MPQDILFDDMVYSVATEEELLEFANTIRQAGGADVLEALLPSTPLEPNSCLIANALNFSCSVDGISATTEAGVRLWHMKLPSDMDYDRAKALADSVGCSVSIVSTYSDGLRCHNEYVEITKEQAEAYKVVGRFVIVLPEHIGNAAAAFDDGVAFQQYVEWRCDDCGRRGCSTC